MDARRKKRLEKKAARWDEAGSTVELEAHDVLMPIQQVLDRVKDDAKLRPHIKDQVESELLRLWKVASSTVTDAENALYELYTELHERAYEIECDLEEAEETGG